MIQESELHPSDHMDEYLWELCIEHEVDFMHLVQKVQAGREGKPCIFTAGDMAVISACLQVAGGL